MRMPNTPDNAHVFAERVLAALGAEGQSIGLAKVRQAVAQAAGGRNWNDFLVRLETNASPSAAPVPAPVPAKGGDPLIKRILDISTAHLSLSTRDKLSAGLYSVSMVSEYGWLISTCKEVGTGKGGHAADPEDLARIRRLGRRKAVDWVLVDRDADMHPALPDYNDTDEIVSWPEPFGAVSEVD